MWAPHYQKDKDRLEKVQRRFTRMLQGMKESEYPERLKRLGLWTLKERRNRADLIKVFKLSSGNTALSLKSFFVVDTGRLDVLEVTQ